MHRLLLAIAALPALVSATPNYGTVNSDMPPERFRGDSASVVVFTDRQGIEENCGKAQPGFVIIACHRQTMKGVNVIFMPNPCLLGDSEFYAKIQCHENAHGNGWSGSGTVAESVGTVSFWVIGSLGHGVIGSGDRVSGCRGGRIRD
mgnify:CR=1 FL=1